MNDQAESAAAASRAPGRSRRRWLVIVVAVWLLGALAVFLLHGWLLDRIVAEAERRGIVLSGCQLDLGLGAVALEGCGFAAKPDGRVFNPALADVAMGGRVERIEVGLSGLSPSRALVRGAAVSLVGEPRLAQLLRSGGSVPTTELPVDVAESAISWQTDAKASPSVLLSGITYDAGVNRLSSRFEVVRRAHGQLSLGAEGVEVTLGDPARPEVRLIARVLPKAQRVDVSLDLRRIPLRTLEGPWLQMTDTLRPLEIEGRIFATIPLGLSMETPSGDLHLTLHGLQFPVPRELEGLVYQSAPKLSGKLALSRTFDRVTISDLSFLAGELAMRGDAELSVQGQGLAVKGRANGPLSCRAIADAAATAHADSMLATLAGNFARRTITGSVEVLTAIEGHTSDLEHARVLTSVGFGCGLEPLPFDLGISKELLDRLPIDVFQQIPDVVPPTRPSRRR